ncbi:MAG TPA: transglycosylase domain-containing protein [Sporichthyaceae bacterium]|jgi:membrane peptidoglycan carboxypeptidase|nr:transglycosylase domain-containing protein [Sporichthyaceae bacterium]
MKLFGRGRSKAVPASGPLHSDDDQWFRPLESDEKSRGKLLRRRIPVTAPAGPRAGSESSTDVTGPIAAPIPAADAPTESIQIPPDWRDATAQLPRVKVAPTPELETEPGADGPPPAPVPTKGRPRRRRWLRRLAWGSLVVFAGLFVAILFVYSRIDIPNPNDSALRQTTRIYFGDTGKEIGRFGEVNRVAVPLDKVPQPLQQAVLAAENRNFYNDNGVSPTGIMRAFWNNLHGGNEQGGSTITQQYVKNYYLTPARTFKRKIREALLSIKIDQKLSKKQILEDYLNTIYLGRGAYGVQAAAKAYFNTDVQNLTPAQDVVLASVIRAPARYSANTTAGLTALKARWSYVADSMVGTGALKPDDRKALVFPAIGKQSLITNQYAGQNGYILTAVRAELKDRGLSDEQIDNGGLRVYTTIDPNAEAAAVAAVNQEYPTKDNKGLRVGLVSIDPKTGRVIAMYGGKNFLGKDKYAQVNAALYPIQPGSTMKIFTTATLLENGYTMTSDWDGDSPAKLPHSPSVRNEFHKSFGSVTLQEALDKSINTAFARAAVKVGPARIRQLMVRAGIPDDSPGLETNARITLGIASIRPIYIADALATICNGGVHNEQHIVDKVLGPNGGEVPLRKPDTSASPVIPPDIAYQTIKAMEDVVEHGTGTAAKKLGRPVAGKTGTHQNLTAWFSGCTPQLATSVDYFKGDGLTSLDGTGGLPTFYGAVYPTKTFTTYMKGALKGVPTADFLAPVSSSTSAAPANPYDTSSGVQNTPQVSASDQPTFPTFDTGPDSYTPPPSATPTPSSTGAPNAKPNAKPKIASTSAPAAVHKAAQCTNDPTKQSASTPFSPQCSSDGRERTKPQDVAPN